MSKAITKDDKILVVGAGPTGLTLALELARSGMSVDVVDKRDAASTFSRAVGLIPRSLEILTPSGATDLLLAEGVRYQGAQIFDKTKLVMRLPFTPRKIRHGFDFMLGLAQDRTEAILAERLAAFGGSVTYHKEVVGLEDQGDQVAVLFADASEKFYAKVIGADGIRSTVREEMGVAYNGIELPDTWSIADVEVKDWPHHEIFTVCMLDADAMVVVAPMAKTRMRVIANRTDALSQLPLPINVTKLHRAGDFTISVRQVEAYQKGNLFLAGDAAHCHSPVGGRGMNLGIADAAELAKRLIEGSTEGYHASRHAKGAAIIKGSEMGRKFATSSTGFKQIIVRVVGFIAKHSKFVRQRVAERLLYN